MMLFKEPLSGCLPRGDTGKGGGYGSSPADRPHTHRSMESFCANSRQSLPRELGASRLLHIFWRIDRGILKA